MFGCGCLGIVRYRGILCRYQYFRVYPDIEADIGLYQDMGTYPDIELHPDIGEYQASDRDGIGL